MRVRGLGTDGRTGGCVNERADADNDAGTQRGREKTDLEVEGAVVGLRVAVQPAEDQLAAALDARQPHLLVDRKSVV